MEITTDKRFIITGAGGGIARTVIPAFAEAGARLVLTDLHLEAVHEVACGRDAIALEADLTDQASVRSMVDAARHRLGGVDGLIHTTGGFAAAPAEESDAELLETMLALNLRTLVLTVGAVLPLLLEEGRGFIAGFSAAPGWDRSAGGGMAVYAAAKAGVAAYLHALQAETAGRGIQTAVVYPMGVVDTPANRERMPDADRSTWIGPVAIARALLVAAVSGPSGQVRDLPIFPPG